MAMIECYPSLTFESTRCLVPEEIYTFPKTLSNSDNRKRLGRRVLSLKSIFRFPNGSSMKKKFVKKVALQMEEGSLYEEYTYLHEGPTFKVDDFRMVNNRKLIEMRSREEITKDYRQSGLGAPSLLS